MTAGRPSADRGCGGCSVYAWAHIDYCHSNCRTMFIAYNLYVVTGTAVVLLLLFFVLVVLKKIYTRFYVGHNCIQGPDREIQKNSVIFVILSMFNLFDLFMKSA